MTKGTHYATLLIKQSQCGIEYLISVSFGKNSIVESLIYQDGCTRDINENILFSRISWFRR